MGTEGSILEQKRARLKKLLDSRSESTCDADTRHLSAADIRREQEIEDLEEEIKVLEKQR